jgi:hypothetical protein
LPQSLQTKDHPSGYSMTPIIAPPCFTLNECVFTDADRRHGVTKGKL